MRKKLVFFMLMIVLCICVFTGCIKNTAGDIGSEEKGITATGTAVVGMAKNNTEKDPYCNDRYRYCLGVDYDSVDTVLLQAKLSVPNTEMSVSNKSCKEIKLPSGFDPYKLLYVTNEWLYFGGDNYGKDSEYVNSYVCRVPIKDKETKEYPIWKKKEQICNWVNLGGDGGLYIRDDLGNLELIYITEECKICKVDVETKEKQIIWENNNNDSFIDFLYTDTGEVLHVNGSLVVINVKENKEELYLVDVEKDEIKYLVSHMNSDIWGIDSINENTFFYFDEDNEEVYSYNIQKGELSCLASKEDIKSKLKALHLGDETANEWGYTLINVMHYKDKLYIEVDVSWVQEDTATNGPQKGKVVNRDYSRMVLLSVPCTDMNDIQVEEKLLQYLLENDSYRKRHDGGWYYAWADSRFDGFEGEGDLYIELSDSTITYNVVTKEIKKISKKE